MFFSSRRRNTRFDCDWSSDVCSSDLAVGRWGGENLGLRLSAPPPHRLCGLQGEAAGEDGQRSEERRVGKESRSWQRRQQQNNKNRLIYLLVVVLYFFTQL